MIWLVAAEQWSNIVQSPLSLGWTGENLTKQSGVRAGKAAYRGPALNHYCSALVRPALEGGYCRLRREAGRVLGPAVFQLSLQPKSVCLVKPFQSALSESVDVWPLANTILRHNRGHALTGNRLRM